MALSNKSTMIELELSSPLFFFCLVPLLFLFFINCRTSPKTNRSSSSSNKLTTKLPTSYPLLGSFLTIVKNRDRSVQWTSDLVRSTPTSTFILHRAFGQRSVITANPANVQHILKTHFHIYQKGDIFRTTLKDLLGDGIFNTDGDNWKFQRQVSSHEFNTKSLRKFIETVVDAELSNRLIPILATAAASKTVLDFQDILQRFAFDNICKIAFGYDPAYLLPSLPDTEFAVAFEEAVRLSSQRFISVAPLVWKIKRVLNIGSEKKLAEAISHIREFAEQIIKEKKQELSEKLSLDSVDLLSRFLSSGQFDDDLVTDIVISFLLAGRDTTSAALTWFFWLLSGNRDVETDILEEIREMSEGTVYDEVKDMVYTHASLCESMRLYPPVPIDGKQAESDDVLPDGTALKKGMRVSYHPYAMGRLEKLWGKDWAQFRPGRWLEKNPAGAAAGKWSFVARDSYTYPVFQAGPRICLGKEMAFLQMKRVVAGVLRRFRVIPAVDDGVEPVFVAYLTSKMKGGFPVRIEERAGRGGA
uniref:Cytochrome P450 n=1 Tax=Nothapodytes nimmoniana TaxID=159386 RepID=A0A7L7RB79_NOTNI|nr:cytochrome P450 [Nothapodytes nimmoniana]